MVGPCANAIETAKNGRPRFAFSEPSIGSRTTQSSGFSPTTSRPSSSEISTKLSPLDRRRSTMTRSAAASIAVVSSPPIPAPTTGSRSARMGRSASTPRRSATASRHSASQSFIRARALGSLTRGAEREEEQARKQLRIEVCRLLREGLAPRRSREDLVDPGWADEVGDGRLALVDAPDGLAPVGRVGDALVPQPVHELDVEHTVVARRQARATGHVFDGRSAILRQPLERPDGARGVRLDDAAPIAVTVRRALEHAVRREDRHAGIARADQYGEQIGAVLGPVLLVERQCGLVAVVAVSDEQLPVGEDLSELLVGEPPQARPVDLEVRRGGRYLERRGTVIEQEDRLDVRTYGAQEPEPALLWASVRPLVGQDDPPLVRLDPKRRREAGARARDAVRSDVVLRQRPEGRGSSRRAPSARHSRQRSAASSSRSGNVRCTTLKGPRAASRSRSSGETTS